MKMKKKIVLGIIILLAFFIGILVGYIVFYPKSTKTFEESTYYYESNIPVNPMNLNPMDTEYNYSPTEKQ